MAKRVVQTVSLFILTVAVALPWTFQIAAAASLLFSDTDEDGVGRVEIRIDDAETPADIGSTDFTLEFWMKSANGNTAPEVGCDRTGYNWIEGNIVFDRDRLAGSARDYGLAIAGGRIAFGVENANGAYTICSTGNVLDGQWRHIAVQRRMADGMLWLYLDGVLEQQASGPAGDISYPNGETGDPREALLVLGREKFDLGPSGFRGWIDEIRLSNTLRYQGDAFAVRTEPFALDASTLALYHLDEATGDTIVDQNSNQSPGVRRHSAAAGPEWSADTPFGSVSSTGRIEFIASVQPAVSEGTATLAITVRRSGGSAGPATVEIEIVGGSATEGADYELSPRALSWADGDTAPKTFSLSIIDDTLIEGDETVQLTLVNATGSSLGASAETTVMINDNDQTSPPPPNGGGASGDSGGGGAMGGFWLVLGLAGAVCRRLILRVVRSVDRRSRHRDVLYDGVVNWIRAKPGPADGRGSRY